MFVHHVVDVCGFRGPVVRDAIRIQSNCVSKRFYWSELVCEEVKNFGGTGTNVLLLERDDTVSFFHFHIFLSFKQNCKHSKLEKKPKT